MIIQHNIPAMNSYRNLNNNQNQISGNLEKLSSGYQINRAGDNAAGLAISEKMRSQITGLGQAFKNSADGVSLVKTGEGAMQEIHDMINRLKEMAVQSANGTYDNAVDRDALQKEADQLTTEIDRIADSTNFNGIYLLKGERPVFGSKMLEFIAYSEGVEGEYITLESAPSSRVLNIDESKIVTAGSFTVVGGELGVDFTYDASSGALTILSSTDMRIEGTGTETNTESIVVDDSAGAANLALKNVNIVNTSGSAFYTGANDVYIELEGENVLSSDFKSSAGLNVGESGSVIIDGAGKLTAACDQQHLGASGIGSDVDGKGGDITINGGTIVASGGAGGTGIGSGDRGSIGSIYITGGDITATGGQCNAGIGCGFSAEIGLIQITGGTIVANGGTQAAGIGTGQGATAGNIIITNIDDITAKGQNGSDDIGEGVGGTAAMGSIVTVSDPNDINIMGPSSTTINILKATKDFMGIILQIGETGDDFNKLIVPLFDCHSENLGLDSYDISTQDNAMNSIDKATSAANVISTYRAEYGAKQNRLEHTLNVLSIQEENIQDAESTIRDTDMAKEMMEYTKNNILIQSAQSMLAHANSMPQQVLQLLN